jgi:hypothetical protein
MMRSGLLVILTLTGCTTYFGGDDDVEFHHPALDAGSGGAPYDGGGYVETGLHCGYQPDPIEVMPPGACAQSVTLSLAASRKDLSATLTTTPTTFCITLDTLGRTHPTYFDAQTPIEPGTRSKFAFAIYSSTNQLLCAGYDAPLSSMVQTYATASLDIRDTAIFDIKLVAWARQTPATTPITMSLYQVLD